MKSKGSDSQNLSEIEFGWKKFKKFSLKRLFVAKMETQESRIFKPVSYSSKKHKFILVICFILSHRIWELCRFVSPMSNDKLSLLLIRLINKKVFKQFDSLNIIYLQRNSFKGDDKCQDSIHFRALFLLV